MNFKRVTSLIIIGVMATSLLLGCTSKKDEDKGIAEKTIKVVMPDGLPSIAMAKLVKENNQLKKGYKVEYSIEKTPENLSTSVMKEAADIAIVPSNMASIAYNKTKNYQIAGTIGVGSLYLISTDDSRDYEDLKGKSIANIGRGLTPDIVAKNIFKEKGLEADRDITFNYFNGASELVPTIIAGKEKIAVVPEPALSALMTKKPEVKILKSLNDEWKIINNSKMGYPQSTIIVKKSFAEKNKDFVKGFLSEVDKTTKWANENKEELANYSEKIGVSTEKLMIPKAMERANIGFIHINQSKKEYENYYKKLFEFDPSSVGGTLPDEGIFMER